MSKITKKIRGFAGNIKQKSVVLASVGVLIAAGGTTVALQQNSNTGAEEVPPIVKQVNDHEERIDGLEGRADSIETKVEQNSSDIGALQQVTGVAPTTATPTPTQTENREVIEQPVQPAAPVVEPPKDPRTVLAVTDTPYGDGSMHECDYTFVSDVLNRHTAPVRQPISQPCTPVGEIYTR